MFYTVRFGERLADLLYEKRITPIMLSRALAIDLSLLYRYLRKEFLPSLRAAVDIADYFNCSTDYLFGLSDDYTAHSYKTVNSFSNQFAKLLKSNGYTRYRFKKETGIAKQSVDDWYNGVRLPSAENVVIIALFFGCTLDYLLGRE